MLADGPNGAALTYLVLIPSYNTGRTLFETVADAVQHGLPVWVVIDGSTDGTGAALCEAYRDERRVRVLLRTANGGKGEAVLDGLQAAADAGFTHALVMDADGQHPASFIPKFVSLSCQHPAAMILGVPVFDAAAPRLRVLGRRISNGLTKIETLGAVGDSLFGFRVYPVKPLLAVMTTQHWMRRFDFDAEAVVRLYWRGVAAINQPAPVRYLRPDQGGISHFRYGRDNFLLAGMHARLMAGFILRAPWLILRRFRSSRH
jgi:glycosyltransferase involved in cell wall biosynthesis